MAWFQITSKTQPGYHVTLADTTLGHAQTVFDQLLVEPTFPSDIRLDEIPDPTVPRRTWRVTWPWR